MRGTQGDGHAARNAAEVEDARRVALAAHAHRFRIARACVRRPSRAKLYRLLHAASVLRHGVSDEHPGTIRRGDRYSLALRRTAFSDDAGTVGELDASRMVPAACYASSLAATNESSAAAARMSVFIRRPESVVRSLLEQIIDIRPQLAHVIRPVAIHFPSRPGEPPPMIATPVLDRLVGCAEGCV